MSECSVVSDSLPAHRLEPTRFLCPWNSPGENTGVGCHFLLQGIFLTQGPWGHKESDTTEQLTFSPPPLLTFKTQFEVIDLSHTFSAPAWGLDIFQRSLDFLH